MLRLPPYRYHRPERLDEALELLEAHGAMARIIAGGTDLIPNMKHGLFTPDHLVSLRGLGELKGIEAKPKGGLRLGAGVTLAEVAASEAVLGAAPALARAARNVAGPQLRNAGTLGGNLCLDTRCTYYNQSEFWREALGYCLKKDGDRCHVTRTGRVCVAAHSADTPPVLMALGATLELASPRGRRTMAIRDFFMPDGVWNQKREPDEVVTAIEVPPVEDGLRRRTAHGKLRIRKSIDFPLISMGLAAWFDEAGTVVGLEGVVTGLGSRPRHLTRFGELALGERWSPELMEALAARAHAQCTPLENHIVDPDWRKAMVPVIMRRTLQQLGPVEGAA